MALAGIQLTAEIMNLKELQEGLGRIFTPEQKARIVKAAMEKAILPAFERLKQITPVGPTGNLKRAVAKKTVAYNKTGVAVGLVGFQRAGRQPSESAQGGSVRVGKDRGYHQWWLEEGTKERLVNKLSNTPYTRRAHIRRMKSGVEALVLDHVVKGQNAYIASSFNRLGPFKFTKQTSGDRSRVQTDPAYPRAFFKKSRDPIVIPPMQPGGLSDPPLKTAWDQTKGQVAEILQRELRISLEAALSTLSRSSSGTLGT
jgi:hypothetical protein